MKRPPLLAICCLTAGLLTSPVTTSVCRGDLILEFQPANLDPGGIGFIDVLISSTGTDLVAIASYKFQITQLSGTGLLEFGESSGPAGAMDRNRQSNSEQSFVATSGPGFDYIFVGNTAPANFAATRQSDTLQLVGSDSTADSLNAMLTTTPRLLTRLELIHTAPPGSLGGTYSLSLIEDTNNTFFLREDFTRVGIPQSSFNNSGLITVGVSAVPEPSSLLLSALALATFALRRGRKRSLDRGIRSRKVQR